MNLQLWSWLLVSLIFSYVLDYRYILSDQKTKIISKCLYLLTYILCWYRGLVGRFVLSHCWDQEEPKLLVCEAKRHPQATSLGTKEQAPLWTRRASSTVMTMPAFNDNTASTNRLAAVQVIILNF